MAQLYQNQHTFVDSKCQFLGANSMHKRMHNAIVLELRACPAHIDVYKCNVQSGNCLTVYSVTWYAKDYRRNLFTVYVFPLIF